MQNRRPAKVERYRGAAVFGRNRQKLVDRQDAEPEEVQAFVAMVAWSITKRSTSPRRSTAPGAGMKVLMRFGSGVPDLPNLIARLQRGWHSVGSSPSARMCCSPKRWRKAV